jgi:CRISPR-associated protein Cmr5
MSRQTRSQGLAQTAYLQIAKHIEKQTGDGQKKPAKEFISTVKKFPALIHTCGLAQAVAFAMAKKDQEYVGYLAAVLHASGHPEVTSAKKLDDCARTSDLNGYLRLSRDAIAAASWLKRYVEAAAGEEG